MPANIPTIKALVIDDEKEACDNLINILHEYITPDINIIGIANDTAEAELLINELNPDAVFLDIEMPGENAFQFLSRMHPHSFDIIFVTAYDEFAIKAFKLNAVDYILKPICIEELGEAIVKLRERISYRQFVKFSDHQINAVKQIANKEPPRKITLKSLNHVDVVDFKDIYSIEGLGSYCKIFYNKSGANKEITTSNIIAYYEEILPADLFFRVHKSFLVNCMHIKDIIFGDNYSVVIKTLEHIPISRRRYGAFINFLKENNFYRA